MTVALNRICHQTGEAASLPRMSYLAVDPPAMEPTRLWPVPGPERTLRPSVVVALRLSCGKAAVVPCAAVQGPWAALRVARTCTA